MQNKRYLRDRLAGFSLIEVMVGLVIGLLTILVIMQSFAAFEGQKRTTTSGMDAQENGLIALHTLQTDVRMAGRGMLVDMDQNGTPELAFNRLNLWRGGATALSTIMLPVAITDGGSGANNSDSVEIVYSNSSCAGTPMRITVPMPQPSNITTVGAATCTAADDLLILAGPGLPGSLLKETGDPQPTGQGNFNLRTNSSAGDGSNYWNPPGGQSGYFPAGGYGLGSFVLNMGQMVHNRYQAQCDTFTVSNRLTQSGAVSCTDQNTFSNALPLNSSIVNIQAQFGIAPAGSQAVNCWANATDTACSPTNGDWTAANLAPADIVRIKAVRVAIVARSSLRERPTTGTTCDATTTAPTLFNGVSGAPVVNLSGDPNWQCYRYKVYETIIPLRNIMWANV